MTKDPNIPQSLGELAITPRPLDDYREMFLITDADLAAGPILDCPAGASPFGAQVRALGGTVISVDPAYSASRAEIIARARADVVRIAEWMAGHPDQFDLSRRGSVDSEVRKWEAAIDEFAADYRADGERYVTAALPDLPFPDGHFRLALSSYLVFVYPEHFDFDWHVNGLLELIRVTHGEVRVFPLVDTAARPYPRLDDVRSVLAGHGVQTEIQITTCAFSDGGDQLLVCRRNPATTGQW
ncbi:MAG: hypothetical protein ACRDRP_12705 [Pseudonocardiaceae bacterium]